MIVIVVTLFVPWYHIRYSINSSNHPEHNDAFYNFWYTIVSCDVNCDVNGTDTFFFSEQAGFHFISFSSDELVKDVVFGTAWGLTLATVPFLLVAAIRKSRGRVTSFGFFAFAVFAALTLMFVPLVFDGDQCKAIENTLTTDGFEDPDKNPCTQIWGTNEDATKTKELKWRPYYGWYGVVICAAVLSLAMIILSVITPKPDDNEEYVPITKHAHSDYDSKTYYNN